MAGRMRRRNKKRKQQDIQGRRIKVDVLITTYRGMQFEPYNATLKMVNTTARDGRYDVRQPVLSKCGQIAWARNNALLEVRPDADFVLFCDDDMLPEPDHLIRLLEHNVWIVSGLCTTRDEFPTTLCVKHYDKETDTFTHISDIKLDKLVRGPVGVGAAFLLLSRDCLEFARNHFLEARDWADDMAPIFKRLGISDEIAEAERVRMSAKRRKNIAEKKLSPQVFQFYQNDDGMMIGEDTSFCRRLIRAGHEIYVDTSVQVGHFGGFPYGPWNIHDKSAREVMTG